MYRTGSLMALRDELSRAASQPVPAPSCDNGGSGCGVVLRSSLHDNALARGRGSGGDPSRSPELRSLADSGRLTTWSAERCRQAAPPDAPAQARAAWTAAAAETARQNAHECVTVWPDPCRIELSESVLYHAVHDFRDAHDVWPVLDAITLGKQRLWHNSTP